MSTTEERAKKICHDYMNVICPYVVQYEVLTNTFPIEILNEVRAVLGHLSKYHLSDELPAKERNLEKAEGHIKRALFDCHKYLCMAYEDRYKSFERMYRYVDLSHIDNGEFLPKLLDIRETAKRSLKHARTMEFSIGAESAAVYAEYEKAFVNYASVHGLLEVSFKKLETFRRKAVVKHYLAIGSFILGAVGVILTVLQLL